MKCLVSAILAFAFTTGHAMAVDESVIVGTCRGKRGMSQWSL
jgi:hypothetical protein